MELARNLKTDNVARLQPAPPVVVATDCTIADAVKLMRQKQVSWLLVCAGKKLAGIFTQRDLLMRVMVTNRPMNGPIREVMTPDPVTRLASLESWGRVPRRAPTKSRSSPDHVPPGADMPQTRRPVQACEVLKR